MTTVRLARYRDAFRTSHASQVYGLTLGGGALVRIRSLEMVPIDRTSGAGGKPVEIRAVVELSTEAVLMNHEERAACAFCGVSPPEPDQDAMWGLLENHSNGRCAFPTPEHGRRHSDADHYTIAGWTDLPNEDHYQQLCPTCSVELKAAIEATRLRISSEVQR